MDSRNTSSDLPLAGVRVLDAATFIAGPYCATMMAEFGAEVIKIEHPTVGDPLRNLGLRVEGGETLTWISEARNKKTVTLNLGQKEGAEIFKSLVARADVVIENFRPGTMEKWGLGYEDLAAINPRIVMLRILAYGQDGPYRDRAGFARIAHAFGGLSYLSGMPDGTPVVPGSTSLADYISGIYGAFGVILAMREQERSGKGQVVDVALYESVFRLLDELAPAFAKFGFVRERLGADAPTIAPHSHYQCADGAWIALACSSDKMFMRLARLMGCVELCSDARFVTMQDRVINKDVLNDIISRWVGAFAKNEFLDMCMKSEIPVGPINSIADIFDDPQIAARGNLVTLDYEDAGEITVPNIVPRLSRTPGKIEHLGRHMAADNDEIYGDLLGMSRETLDDLRLRQVI